MKHIVIITPGFAVNEKDDYTISALQIYCKKLQERSDIKLSVITLHYPYTKKKYQWYNCSIYPLGFNNKKNFLFFLNRKVLKQLRIINKQNTIDCIHSFWLGESAFWGYSFSKKHAIKHITTLMGKDAKKGNKFAKILPLKKMLLITLSKFHQNVFLENYKISTMLIPWGIDQNEKPNVTKKTIDIIGIGSLIPLKKYTEFITTIAILKKTLPKIRVTLIGDGQLKEQHLKQIKDLGLSQTITLTGQLTYQKTQQLLSKSKILLHTSMYESFGMVFAEAMANNVNIVSKKVGFAKESNHWKIAKNSEEFAIECHVFLTQNFKENTGFPKIETTVEKYLKLY